MGEKIGVLLSGCGVFDGSEIHEATLTLYFLAKHGAEIVCMAPNKKQSDVVNHFTNQPSGESRNVLHEAARIARGSIRDVSTVRSADIDGIIIPGGFGAAKNLCSFAKDGPKCEVDPSVARLLADLHATRKPIGALCIAPALLARLFGVQSHVKLTIGTDSGTASALEKMGARHQSARPDEIVVDEENGIVTTPCYMTAPSIVEVGIGAEKVVATIMQMASVRRVKSAPASQG
jgi:enhancing lycopene biosynthesis protein 2